MSSDSSKHKKKTKVAQISHANEAPIDYSKKGIVRHFPKKAQYAIGVPLGLALAVAAFAVAIVLETWTAFVIACIGAAAVFFGLNILERCFPEDDLSPIRSCLTKLGGIGLCLSITYIFVDKFWA